MEHIDEVQDIIMLTKKTLRIPNSPRRSPWTPWKLRLKRLIGDSIHQLRFSLGKPCKQAGDDKYASHG